MIKESSDLFHWCVRRVERNWSIWAFGVWTYVLLRDFHSSYMRDRIVSDSATFTVRDENEKLLSVELLLRNVRHYKKGSHLAHRATTVIRTAVCIEETERLSMWKKYAKCARKILYLKLYSKRRSRYKNFPLFSIRWIINWHTSLVFKFN